MKTTYKNPWYRRIKYPKTGWPTPDDRYHTEYFESDSEPEAVNGCLIYARQEYGYPIFDVVVDGMAVAQRATANGARLAAEAKVWEGTDWWKELMEEKEKGAKRNGGSVQMTGSALALSLGWEVARRSLYDEEGVEGWAWIAPDGAEFIEIGSWNKAAPWPDEAQAYLDKQNSAIRLNAPSGNETQKEEER